MQSHRRLASSGRNVSAFQLVWSRFENGGGKIVPEEKRKTIRRLIGRQRRGIIYVGHCGVNWKRWDACHKRASGLTKCKRSHMFRLGCSNSSYVRLYFLKSAETERYNVFLRNIQKTCSETKNWSVFFSQSREADVKSYVHSNSRHPAVPWHEATKSIYYTIPLDGMLVYRRLTLSILLHGIITSPRMRLNKQIFASKGVKFVFLGWSAVNKNIWLYIMKATRSSNPNQHV